MGKEAIGPNFGGGEGEGRIIIVTEEGVAIVVDDEETELPEEQRGLLAEIVNYVVRTCPDLSNTDPDLYGKLVRALTDPNSANLERVLKTYGIKGEGFKVPEELSSEGFAGIEEGPELDSEGFTPIKGLE